MRMSGEGGAIGIGSPMPALVDIRNPGRQVPTGAQVTRITQIY